MQEQPHGHAVRDAAGRVLTDIKHGGHVLTDDSEEAAALARHQESVVEASPRQREELDDETTTAFDYLFDGLAKHFPDNHLPNDHPAATVAALQALGAAMVEDPPLAADPLQPLSNSVIPPVYTYWGQFVDHDLTANTDRDSAVSNITKPDLVPLEPPFVVENLRNLRQPALNLDSVYGDGPTLGSGTPTEAANLYDGIKLKVGKVAEVSNNAARPIRGVKVPPEADLARDLPRVAKKALIGDARNDENLVIAQLHTAFLRFHNAAVDWVTAHDPGYDSDADVFARARQLTQWHYQWLVIHDFLKTIALPGVADQVLLGGNRFWKPRHGRVYMPLEYSVAAYRFGHSMVRAVYDYNRNFGRPGNNVAPNASFNLLFTFTGNGNPAPFFGDTDVLPFNWIIEWDRFVDHGAAFPDRFARKIDTRLSPPLRDLTNEGNDPAIAVTVKEILKRLATRNLLRGYLLALPTGQAAAAALGVVPLTAAELQRDNNPVLNDALAAGGFLARTPLWYYVLKEAEVRANGNSLGPVGSRIVCETIIGQVREDPDSYLRQPGTWTPEEGVRLPSGELVVTIADFLRFAGVLS